ncbi:MAG TPA: helix-turn-helix domain-containing protein [Povalibacter sp.]|uniref:GlxA family transcriptional regulator n=1 Tax=Povalibacter sp. TaxID=1962978 RepID=UPI002C4F1363|nr:helix-turn-helix domain-containing protein [Povalibacter sp.]HMN45275.1 helix-turn-helix domain-containing protein [Povalibacter sp.]
MRPVLFAMLPDLVLLDVAGAAEAFRIANQEVPGTYDLRFVAPTPGLRTGVGLELHKLPPLPKRVADESIVVITGVTGSAVRFDRPEIQQLIEWLKPVAANPAVTIMCVCAGSVIAAKAGVLRGRECTTHHEHIEELAAIEPTAVVHANRLFVEDGRLFTSAGVTAGTDLALHMIGQHLGHQVAASVARKLVVYMRRSGTDPQLSPWLMHRNHIHPAVHRVQDAVTKQPTADWSSQRLASVACMSERNLARLFAEHAACSPLDYVQRMRVALARDLLTNSSLDIERVAERAGFSSAHHLRRVWRRWESRAPSEQRATV